MALLLKGASAANALIEELTPRAALLLSSGVIPCLAIIRVGDREDDLSYETAAVRRCGSLGIPVRSFVFSSAVSQEELLSCIDTVNRDSSIHGCLLFRPLPRHLDEQAICAALDPHKDIDGITPLSMAKIYSGSGSGFAPCTAQSCIELLRYYGIEVSGKKAVVIGRSLVIGRPVSMLLLAENATVTVCHSRTVNLAETVHNADIVVAALGKAEALSTEFFRAGQTVLDVGINWSNAKQRIVGDIDFESVEPIVAAISPVPSGVGSVTTAVLCKHVIEAAEQSA